MLAERAATRPRSPVVLLDVVSLRAFRIVVMHGFPRTFGMPRKRSRHVPVFSCYVLELRFGSRAERVLEVEPWSRSVHSKSTLGAFRLSPPIEKVYGVHSFFLLANSTSSSISHTWSVRPDSIAGVTRSDLCTRQKL